MDWAETWHTSPYHQNKLVYKVSAIYCCLKIWIVSKLPSLFTGALDPLVSKWNKASLKFFMFFLLQFFFPFSFLAILHIVSINTTMIYPINVYNNWSSFITIMILHVSINTPMIYPIINYHNWYSFITYFILQISINATMILIEVKFSTFLCIFDLFYFCFISQLLIGIFSDFFWSWICQWVYGSWGKEGVLHQSLGQNVFFSIWLWRLAFELYVPLQKVHNSFFCFVTLAFQKSISVCFCWISAACCWIVVACFHRKLK